MLATHFFAQNLKQSGLKWVRCDKINNLNYIILKLLESPLVTRACLCKVGLQGLLGALRSNFPNSRYIPGANRGGTAPVFMQLTDRSSIFIA